LNLGDSTKFEEALGGVLVCAWLRWRVYAGQSMRGAKPCNINTPPQAKRRGACKQCYSYSSLFPYCWIVVVWGKDTFTEAITTIDFCAKLTFSVGFAFTEAIPTIDFLGYLVRPPVSPSGASTRRFVVSNTAGQAVSAPVLSPCSLRSLCRVNGPVAMPGPLRSLCRVNGSVVMPSPLRSLCRVNGSVPPPEEMKLFWPH
jgi:hypothetical protein